MCIGAVTGRELPAVASSSSHVFIIAGSQYGVYATSMIDIVEGASSSIPVSMNATQLLVGHSAAYIGRSVIVFGGQVRTDPLHSYMHLLS